MCVCVCVCVCLCQSAVVGMFHNMIVGAGKDCFKKGGEAGAGGWRLD